MVLAHGIGTRTDLPVPVGLAAAAAGATLVISFVVLAVWWRRPRRAREGAPLPRAVAAVLDAAPVRTALQVTTLLVASVVVAAGLAGPVDPAVNIAPWAFYVTFWVGLVPVAAVRAGVAAWSTRCGCCTGPAHRSAGADRGRRPSRPASACGRPRCRWRLFSWLELVFPAVRAARRRRCSSSATARAPGSAPAAGSAAWFDRGDGFEVYSTLLGRLAPVGRRADGRLVLRNPLDGAVATPPLPGLAAVVVVLLGSTAFDGITRTQWWRIGPGARRPRLSSTLGLLVDGGAGGSAVCYWAPGCPATGPPAPPSGPASTRRPSIPIAARIRHRPLLHLLHSTGRGRGGSSATHSRPPARPVRHRRQPDRPTRGHADADRPRPGRCHRARPRARRRPRPRRAVRAVPPRPALGPAPAGRRDGRCFTVGGLGLLLGF